MKSVRQPFTFDRVIRILFTVVAIVAVFYLIGLLKNALLPFLVAWLLAYLINPFVEFIQYRCRVKIRIISIFLALLSVIGIIALFIWLIMPGGGSYQNADFDTRLSFPWSIDNSVYTRKLAYVFAGEDRFYQDCRSDESAGLA